MQLLEASGAVRPLQGSLGVKGLIKPVMLQPQLRWEGRGRKSHMYDKFTNV